MEYVYAALMLHKLQKDVTEENVTSVVKATGAEVNEAQVKALVASLADVDIEEAIKAAPVAVAAATSSGETEGSDEAEVASGDLLLAEVGDKKVDVIKAVRSITGLGLKDAKGLVDGAPSVIKEGIPKTEADEYFKQLEEAGAKAEFK